MLTVREADEFNSRWQRHRIKMEKIDYDPVGVEPLCVIIRPFQGQVLVD
jgi:hypothetical protein